MKVKTIFMKICCCENANSDDEQMLVTDEEGGDTNIVPTRGRASRESLNNIWIPGSASNSIQGTPVTRNIQTDNEEEQMLKEIIDATRQNIVVIGNTNELAPNNEEIARAKRYQDIVKQHDSRLWKLHPPTTVNVDSSGLKDMGDHVFEALSADPVSPVTLDSIRDAAKHCSEAVISGMRIGHKQEIIVHMPLEDDVIDEES